MSCYCILVAKMKQYGLAPKVGEKNNSTQSVAVNCFKSNCQPVVSGVPWGQLWAWYCLTSVPGTSATENQASQ